MSDLRTTGATTNGKARASLVTSRPSATIAAFAAALLLAACSGAPNPPGAPGATGAQGGPAGATAAPAGPTATQAPGGASATAAPGGPGATLAPGASPSTDACAVLSATDIQAVTGATLVTTVPAQQQGIFTNGCLYELNDGSTTTTVNLGVMVPGGRAYYDANVRNAGYGSIEGLGEAAVKARAGAVMVLAGDVLLSVQYFGPTGPDDSTAAEFATKILANLGL
ncbi:MAG TPA: hypothetical protein VFP56_09805 [Candidatus Limnocylindrales bacterium]|nr:hypothetical protein [Candidatus Limnocylindrales bacterium]